VRTEVARVREFVIFAIPENEKRVRVAAYPSNKYPLPFGAEIITRVVEPDLDMMVSWAKRRAKRGWDIGKIKAACE
jgi:hypothetical protein